MIVMSSHYLEKLFAPHSVALVGATDRNGALGRAVFDNLLAGGFAGPVYAVNPKHRQVQGKVCYASLDALPAPADLALIVTPAASVPGVLRDAAAAGMHHAVILSAGFGETGAAGRALQEDVARTARTNGIRLIGPNCLGLMRPSIGLNATFARGSARPGSIALVSQSGAMCAALADWAWTAGIGFSSVVSMGAAADLDFGEILDYLLHDEATSSILMYVEGVREARRFISGLRSAARSKPIVVLKAGHGAAGAHAALSHTGALTGNDAVFDAVLRRCGVVRAGTYAEMFAAARLLGAGRLPTGNRLAILTNGGGAGVIAADCAHQRGIELAALSDHTLHALNAVLPAHWSHGNPVDIIGDADAQRFGGALAPLLADPGVDGVLTLFCPQIVTTSEDAASTLLALAKPAEKPVLTAWLGGAAVNGGRAVIEAAGMPAFDNPESGVIAFAALAEYHRAQQLLLEVPAPLASTAAPRIDAAWALARQVSGNGRTLMSEPESKQLLECFGIATPATVVARTLVEAIAAGTALGYPLALKILSQDITHKSDVQGVTLHVRDLPELEREFRNLLARTAKLRPDARLEGVAIQPMVEKRFGRELMIGVARDPVFGQVISFGAGGVAVELLRDHAIGLPPLNARLADELIARTRIARLLGAYRHIPAASHAAIADVLLKVSEMVCALPWLQEMDINPLTVDADGAVALDARVVIDPAGLANDAGDASLDTARHASRYTPRYNHMAIHPYPAHLQQSGQLRDGTQVLVRPVRPEDAQMEVAFAERLSEHSRYMRFFSTSRHIQPGLLARLTQLDYERELALLALHDEGGAASERMIGVARYAANADAESCEFAVTIDDAWNQRGVATLLMQRLLDAARAAGYRRMTGSVLAENQPMHALMRGLGFTVQPHSADPAVTEYARNLADITAPHA